MSYTTRFSFKITDADGSNEVDMLTDHHISIVGGVWPMVPTPEVESINIPLMDGGYSYVNNPRPGDFPMRLICDPEEADLDTLMDHIVAFGVATAPANIYRIYIDGIAGYYWLGRRVTGIEELPVGQRALEFDVVWHLDNPNPVYEGT